MGEGRVFLSVDNLEKAFTFYRNVLGIPVARVASRWVDLSPMLGLTHSVEDEAPVEFHVENFLEAADRLEKAGIHVERPDGQAGRLRDPFGNLTGIHDQRKLQTRSERLPSA